MHKVKIFWLSSFSFTFLIVHIREYLFKRFKWLAFKIAVLGMKVTSKFERFQSFERIWEHTKDKGRGNCSLHRAIVKPSSKYFCRIA